MTVIAHEAPLSIMRKVRDVTDYSYALVHLMEESPEYVEYFEESLKMKNHFVILDNSIFELGHAFDHDKFKFWIEKINPTQYIIPDVLEDAEATTDNAADWVRSYKNSNCETIGVVQGKTYREIRDCYEALDKIVDKIAISFDYSYYLKIGEGKTKWHQYMDGRSKLISKLYDDGVINDRRGHHCLGAALPQEGLFYRYKGWKWIDSMDTSSPVLHGIKGVKYQEHGLDEKNPTKLVEHFNDEITPEQWNIIKYNIVAFKKLGQTFPL